MSETRDKTNECYTCELISRRDNDAAPLWDNIFRTPYWDVVHSYNTELPGWLVLIPRRHIIALDEMNDAESAELGILIRNISAALKGVTGSLKTYVMQFAEHPQHPHVHFHIVPRMENQPDERRACQIMKYLGVPENYRVSEEEMNEIGKQIRQRLSAMDNG